jgi:TRAP-type uncharacterized transport system fused permease subunit
MLSQVLTTALAELTLENRETVLWLGGPLMLSLSVLIAGLLVRGYSRQAGAALLVLGIGGLILSAGWIAFAFYVDARLGDT